MSGRVVWHNGKIIPESEAKVSIYDSALMFGDMIFEMTRSFNGIQFKLEEHIKRLYYGIEILQIPITITQKEIYDACIKTIDINTPFFNKDDEHRLMIDVSRGLLGIYNEIGNTEPNVMIADFPLRWTVQGMGKLFDEGINAVITSQRAIPSQYLDPKIKNRSRIHYLMANIEASNMKGKNNWALLLDPDGFVAEGTGDNFFIIKDNEIITPEPRNILRGISREFIFKMCKKIGLNCIEKNIEPYDVYTADGAFMTGTPFCMLPVVSLNGITIGNGERNDLYSKLLQTWSKEVNVDIEKQIKNWDVGNINGTTPYQFKQEN